VNPAHIRGVLEIVTLGSRRFTGVARQPIQPPYRVWLLVGDLSKRSVLDVIEQNLKPEAEDPHSSVGDACTRGRSFRTGHVPAVV